MNRRFLLGVLFGGGLCFALHAIAVFQLDLSARKDASNYWSTIGRFQSAARSEGRLALAGSSITGRFPGAEAGNEWISNLGSDGGGAGEGVQLIVDGVIPMPKDLIIETNTLERVVRPGVLSQSLEQAAKGYWFQIGLRAPSVGASSRPSGVIYSKIKNLKPVPLIEARALADVQPVAFSKFLLPNSLSWGDRIVLYNFEENLRRLQSRGVSIYLVNIPSGEIRKEFAEENYEIIKYLSAKLMIPYLELEGGIDSSSYMLTDGVHLDQESASNVLVTIIKSLNIKKN